jgi:hypothetical protein
MVQPRRANAWRAVSPHHRRRLRSAPAAINECRTFKSTSNAPQHCAAPSDLFVTCAHACPSSKQNFVQSRSYTLCNGVMNRSVHAVNVGASVEEPPKRKTYIPAIPQQSERTFTIFITRLQINATNINEHVEHVASRLFVRPGATACCHQIRKLAHNDATIDKRLDGSRARRSEPTQVGKDRPAQATSTTSFRPKRAAWTSAGGRF